MSSPTAVMLVHQGSEIGGAELMFETLALQLRTKLGIRAAHFCPVPGPLAERLCESFGDDCYVYRKPHRMRDLPAVLRAARSLRKAAREIEAAVLLGSQVRGYLYAGFASRATDARAVQLVHDPVTSHDALGLAVGRLLPPRATVFSSRRAFADSAAAIRRRPSTRIIDAAINRDRIDSCLGRRSGGHASRTFVSVARLQEHKGHECLLRAFARVVEAEPNCRLVCVGDVSPVAGRHFHRRLLAQTEALGLQDKVTFTGFLPDCAVYAHVADAMCLVHAAVHESFGLALLEAMYLRKPVVATRAEGPQRIIRDGETGFLVPVNDADALADRMLRLVRSPSLSERLGDAGRRRLLRNFAPDEMWRGYDRLFAELLDGGRRAGAVGT